MRTHEKTKLSCGLVLIFANMSCSRFFLLPMHASHCPKGHAQALQALCEETTGTACPLGGHPHGSGIAL